MHAIDENLSENCLSIHPNTNINANASNCHANFSVILFSPVAERSRSNGSKTITLISALRNKYSTSSMKSMHCQIFIASNAPGKTGIVQTINLREHEQEHSKT